MRMTPYSFLTDAEFIRLMEEKSSTELEVEAQQRLRIHIEHADEQAKRRPTVYVEQAAA